MGVFVWNRDEIQSFSLFLFGISSNVFVFSFITSAVQFVVAKWIWSSRSKNASDDINQHTISSAHIITAILNMWIIYSVFHTMTYLSLSNSILGYRIVLTVMVIESVLMSLLVFAYLPVKSSKKDDDISADLEEAEPSNVVAHVSSIATGEIVSNDQPKPEPEPPKEEK